MKSRVIGGVLAASLLAGSFTVKAEDIDLFIQPAGNSGLPNVLLMVDNTGNWSAPFTTRSRRSCRSSTTWRSMRTAPRNSGSA